MKSFLRRFIADQSGTTVIEYGVIGTTLSIVLIVSLLIIGPKVSGYFTATGSGMS